MDYFKNLSKEKRRWALLLAFKAVDSGNNKYIAQNELTDFCDRSGIDQKAIEVNDIFIEDLAASVFMSKTSALDYKKQFSFVVTIHFKSYKIYSFYER